MGIEGDPPSPPPADHDPLSGLSADARAIWTDAAATSWGQDNGETFYRRIGGLADAGERIRLCRLFMDRQHASLRTLQQIVYDTWRGELPEGASPVAFRADFGQLVEDGADFRSRFAELVDTAGSDAERAELLTVLVDDGARWLGELRQRRDEAIMEALASGFTPRQLATRLRMSKTQIVNVRHRYLRDLESVGALTHDIVYRSTGGTVTYVNDAYREVTASTRRRRGPDRCGARAPGRRGRGDAHARRGGPARVRTVPAHHPAAYGCRRLGLDRRGLLGPDQPGHRRRRGAGPGSTVSRTVVFVTGPHATALNSRCRCKGSARLPLTVPAGPGRGGAATTQAAVRPTGVLPVPATSDAIVVHEFCAQACAVQPWYAGVPVDRPVGERA